MKDTLGLHIRETENGYIISEGDNGRGGCYYRTWVARNVTELSQIVADLARKVGKAVPPVTEPEHRSK
jgi:hypothetical protein